MSTRVPFVFRPDWGGSGYTLRRYYVDSFCERAAARLAAGSRVLDLGGLRCDKRGQFDISRHPVDVLYLNLVSDRSPDVQADAAAIPLRESLFDCVMCAEVLEHVADPRRIVAEAHRVLKGGGVFVATVPFLYRIHADPEDYGRYTQHYWHRLFKARDWEVAEVTPQGAFTSVLADFAKQAIAAGKARRPFGRVALTIVNAFERFALRREALQDAQDPFYASFTTGFGITAVKRIP